MRIAEAADLVLNGYAVTRDGENFKVINLHSGKEAMHVYASQDSRLRESFA